MNPVGEEHRTWYQDSPEVDKGQDVVSRAEACNTWMEVSLLVYTLARVDYLPWLS